MHPGSVLPLPFVWFSDCGAVELVADQKTEDSETGSLAVAPFVGVWDVLFLG